eukprot:16195497-Heterocapsa_arctica.AAC.1
MDDGTQLSSVGGLDLARQRMRAIMPVVIPHPDAIGCPAHRQVSWTNSRSVSVDRAFFMREKERFPREGFIHGGKICWHAAGIRSGQEPAFPQASGMVVVPGP